MGFLENTNRSSQRNRVLEQTVAFLEPLAGAELLGLSLNTKDEKRKTSSTPHTSNGDNKKKSHTSMP